jgi:hypothetical protein
MEKGSSVRVRASASTDLQALFLLAQSPTIRSRVQDGTRTSRSLPCAADLVLRGARDRLETLSLQEFQIRVASGFAVRPVVHDAVGRSPAFFDVGLGPEVVGDSIEEVEALGCEVELSVQFELVKQETSVRGEGITSTPRQKLNTVKGQEGNSP